MTAKEGGKRYEGVLSGDDDWTVGFAGDQPSSSSPTREVEEARAGCRGRMCVSSWFETFNCVASKGTSVRQVMGFGPWGDTIGRLQ